MDTPTGVIYTGVLMAVTVGMTAWRTAMAQVRVTADTDRMLGACLFASVTLFAAVLAQYYLPDFQLP